MGGPSFSTWILFKSILTLINLNFFMPQFLLFHPRCPSNSPGLGPHRSGSRLTCFPFSIVPHNALPSDLLENVLCGVAFGLGVLGIIVGLSLIVYFRKPCSGGTSGCLEWVGQPWKPQTALLVKACQGHLVVEWEGLYWTPWTSSWMGSGYTHTVTSHRRD